MPQTTATVHQSRKSLLIYFTVLIAVSGFLEWLLITTEGPIRNHLVLILLLMWMPAIASFIARMIFREGFHDISLRVGGKLSIRPMLIGWLFPLAIGTLAYGIAWLSGLASFAQPGVSSPITLSSSIISFVFLIFSRLSLGVIIASFAAAGEEIGWRGYMLTRLIRAKIPSPMFISGFIWGLWHVPLILSGKYASGPQPLISAGLFVLGISAVGFFLAKLRLESDSIWPCIVGHAAWNSTIQDIFDYSTVDVSQNLWIGESGILVVLVTLFFALFLMLNKWSFVKPSYH